jgi:transposase-like protein
MVTELVEVMGRYLNPSDQGERLRDLLQIVPSRPKTVNTRTKKAVHRRLGPTQVEELVTGYQAGATVYQLAEQFRINRKTVSKLLERAGVPRRGRPLSPAQVEQATDLYATGLSLVSVGKQLECDGSTVHLALVKAGVRMRDCQGRER